MCIKNFILQSIFPGFYAVIVNHRIEEKLKKQSNFSVDTTAIASGQEKNYIEQIRSELKDQRERKKTIEDKAKSLLFIITVSISAITFSLTYIKNIEKSTPQTIALIILGISILYLISGAIRAIQTINIKKYYFIQSKFNIDTINNSFKIIANEPDSDLLKTMIVAKNINDSINTQLSNYAYASFILIRNGILLFACFFITTVFSNSLYEKGKTEDTYLFNKEIQLKINDSIDVTIPYTFELKYDLQKLKILNKDESNANQQNTSK